MVCGSLALISGPNANLRVAVTVGECLGDEPQNWYRDPVWVTPATTAKDGCVVSGAQFCGKLDNFEGSKQCFESNGQCWKDAQACMAKQDTDKAACDKMQDLCNMQFLYCTRCDGLKDSCAIEYFIS